MEIPIWIEPAGADGFRATSDWPSPLTAAGATRNEALQALQGLIRARLVHGAELDWMDAPAADDRFHPGPFGAPAMRIPVLIEPVGETRFRASSGWPFAVAAEAPTRDEALRRLGEQIEARMAPGSEFVWLDAPSVENPLAKFAGRLKDDPLFDEWVEAMAEYRRTREEDPDAW